MNLSGVILGSVITEKTARLVEKNQHTLIIAKGATKDDVKAAVRKFFGVAVKSVNIIKTHEKIRVRSARGATPKRKPRVKAIISLAAGQTFDPLNVKTKSASKTTKSDSKPARVRKTSKKTSSKSSSEKSSSDAA